MDEETQGSRCYRGPLTRTMLSYFGYATKAAKKVTLYAHGRGFSLSIPKASCDFWRCHCAGEEGRWRGYCDRSLAIR